HLDSGWNGNTRQVDDVLPAFAQDACIFFAGAPQGHAVIGTTGQENAEGGPPGSVPQDGELDRHDNKPLGRARLLPSRSLLAARQEPRPPDTEVAEVWEKG